MNTRVKRRQSGQKWYEANKDSFNARRREKYANDPVLQQKAVDRARTYREARKKGAKVERETFRTYNGERVQVYTTGHAAQYAKVTSQTIKDWEARGHLPLPVIEGYHRLYLEHQVGLIAMFADYMKEGKSSDATSRASKLEDVVNYIHANW